MELINWTNSDDLDTKGIFWILGMASIGKSTIAYTVAEHCNDQGYNLHESRLLNHSRVYARAMLLVTTKAVAFLAQWSCLIASILEVE